MMFRIFALAIAAIVVFSVPASAADAFNGDRAMADIAAQIAFGPRALDAPGHAKEIAYIETELAKTSAKVEKQEWTYASPDGKTHAMTNIIAHLGPADSRTILATHYDSIVRAYRDKDNPQGYMPGANNSASGVALLLEVARSLNAGAPLASGVDIIFFDGEEGPLSLGEGDRQWVAIGSPYFAQHLPSGYEKSKPDSGIVFDMVCYKNIKLKPEKISAHYATIATAKFWTLGRGIAPAIFSNEITYPIEDDQLALIGAGIPSFLVIGFEYAPWFNTTQDTIDKCSPEVLEGVGKTVLAYLRAS